MKNFNRISEFDREYKKLCKRFRSLDQDLARLQKYIAEFPVGMSSKFAVLHDFGNIKIVKARLACQSLRKSSLRIIYAWHENDATFVYIEIYFKGDKVNENRERIKEYLKKFQIV